MILLKEFSQKLGKMGSEIRGTVGTVGVQLFALGAIENVGTSESTIDGRHTAVDVVSRIRLIESSHTQGRGAGLEMLAHG